MPTALLMGVAQAAALAPGVSRSGATIAAGMLCGLDRDSATRYSFLLAVPVTIAASARTLPAIRSFGDRSGWPALTAAIAAAAVSGWLGIAVMQRLIHIAGLRPFVLYRLALAAAYPLLAPAAKRKPGTILPHQD